MPAAAVIPAPEAYAKVVAVKKLVVEFLAWEPRPGCECALLLPCGSFAILVYLCDRRPSL